MQRGTSLYDGGPKRKGPLRKIVKFQTYDGTNMFGHHTAWLECGHFSHRVFGNDRAICVKCREGKPKDIEGDDGWPVDPEKIDTSPRAQEEAAQLHVPEDNDATS